MSAAQPLEAATVILLRGEEPFEVLMLARHAASSFAPAAWVFPGGAVERRDGEGAGRLRAAALRELAEEADITGLEPSALAAFSRWIAPVSLARRFDTHFFIARAPAGARARADGVECVRAEWLEPAWALAQARVGRLPLLFPTRKQLERLSELRSATAALASASVEALEPVRPRLRFPGDTREPLLPGDPGYESARG